MHTHSYLFGFHAVMAALEKHAPIQALLVFKKREDAKMHKLLQLAAQHGIPVQLESKTTLDQYGKTHQGIVALMQAAEDSAPLMSVESLSEYSLSHKRLILILDGVTDPHNLGACIRSAEALGADGIVLPKDKSASITSIVHKTSAGASQLLPVVTVTNLSDTLKKLKTNGFWTVGLDGYSDTAIQTLDLTAPIALIMGSEGSGLRRLTKENCDFLVNIPMQGQTESLNVSVACGISLFEVSRQRLL